MENSLEQGIALYKAGNYTQVLALLLNGDPGQSAAGNRDYAYYIGLAYMKLKQYEDALPYLELVVTAGENLEQVRQCRFLLAVIYSLTGRERLADFELRKLLDSGYKPGAVYAALAYTAWTQNKTGECLSFYEQALKKEENNVTALNGLGYVLACMGKDLTSALKLCRKAVDAAPNSAACLDSLGWVYYKMGMFDEARKYIEKAKKIDRARKEIAAHYETVIEAEKTTVTIKSENRL
ncbi:MAG: tetratricopeptide repeat protein [Treponema sp.]|nr:tetratricopeptide repeat protein [Treponema sp.]